MDSVFGLSSIWSSLSKSHYKSSPFLISTMPSEGPCNLFSSHPLLLNSLPFSHWYWALPGDDFILDSSPGFDLVYVQHAPWWNLWNPRWALCYGVEWILKFANRGCEKATYILEVIGLIVKQSPLPAPIHLVDENIILRKRTLRACYSHPTQDTLSCFEPGCWLKVEGGLQVKCPVTCLSCPSVELLPASSFL